MANRQTYKDETIYPWLTVLLDSYAICDETVEKMSHAKKSDGNKRWLVIGAVADVVLIQMFPSLLWN